MISAQFEESEDREAAPGRPGQPHSELGREHLHEEPLGVNPLVLVDIVLSGVGTVLEPLGHLAAPDIEAESDEESSSEGHAAHEDARDHVDKRTEETAVLVLVEKHTDPEIKTLSLCTGGDGCVPPVYLCGRDDEHDDTNEYREVTVGLTRPVHHELAVLLPPLPGGEEQAVALEVVLVHRHGDRDAEREDGGYTVASQLERTGVSEGRSEGLLEFGVYLDVEDEVGGFRHSDLGWACSASFRLQRAVTHLLSLGSSALL